MKKEEIRREFFKLKNQGFSYAQCRRVLNAKFECNTTIRTLKRWTKRLDVGDWDLKDKSRRPHRIYKKVDENIEREVLTLRNKTGWGCDKLNAHLSHINIGMRTINNILSKHGLCRETKNKGKQKKWIRWQRKHPNSLWQIDHTDEQNNSKG